MIDITEENKNNKSFKSPFCRSKEFVFRDYFNENKVIDIESNYYKPPIDPFYPYPHPSDNYAIKYEKNYIDHMVNQRLKIIESDERF